MDIKEQELKKIKELEEKKKRKIELYNYKERAEDIGSSQYGCIILLGVKEPFGLRAELLKFTSIQNYTAYILEDIEPPKFYHLFSSFEKWLSVYDENALTRTYKSDKINVFRAGDVGVIIQLVNDKKE
jgi:hypothetical protein